MNVHPATVRRWLRAGAPQVRRGRRGRGGGALVSVPALQAWRAGRREPCGASIERERADLVILAAEVPELLAGAVFEAFCEIEGPRKRLMGEPLALAWYLATTATLDRLRRDCPAVPELQPIPPEKIEYLRRLK